MSPTNDELEEEFTEMQTRAHEPTKFKAGTWEQGAAAALAWAVGETEDKPSEER